MKKLVLSVSAALAQPNSDLFRRSLIFCRTILPGMFLVVSVLFTHVSAQNKPSVSPPANPKTTPALKPEATKSPAVAEVNGIIRGRVISDDGQALPNAIVLAQAITGPVTLKPTHTDAQGGFVFDDLPAAVYYVFASSPGYVDQSLASGDRDKWPRYLIGSDVLVTLTKGGVITGKATNSKGEPVVGAPVSASLVSEEPVASYSMLNLGNSFETDDRGVYRIYGLLSGQYIVTAGGVQIGQFLASGFDMDVPTYYPSSTRDTAASVTVRNGEETAGIDISYRGSGGHSISGVVSGSLQSGSSLNAGISIMIAGAGTTSINSLAFASTAEQGRSFSFNGLPDGEYDLLAVFQAGANENWFTATRRTTVQGADVTGVELKLSQLASVAGTFLLDPIKPQEACDDRASQLIESFIIFRRDEPRKDRNEKLSSFISGPELSVDAKGNFIKRNLVAGKYLFEIKPPTESWYVRAIKLAPAIIGRPPEGWQGVIPVKSGERINGVTIMIGQNAASLRGHVVGLAEGSTIPPGFRVHLVPVDKAQSDNILLYGETSVTRNGTFELANLAPGRYFILARTEQALGGQPRFLQPIAWDSAARTNLRKEAESANAIIELKPCQRLTDYKLEVKPTH